MATRNCVSLSFIRPTMTRLHAPVCRPIILRHLFQWIIARLPRPCRTGTQRCLVDDAGGTFPVHHMSHPVFGSPRSDGICIHFSAVESRSGREGDRPRCIRSYSFVSDSGKKSLPLVYFVKRIRSSCIRCSRRC
jgi:hypothetical protein